MDLRAATLAVDKGGGTSIPSSVVGVWGEMIGSSTDAITPDATTGKKLVYIKLTRTATGDGDLMGNGSGGVAMSIVGDVVSITDGTNTAYYPVVTGFDAVNDQVILVVELTADNMKIGQLVEVSTNVFTYTLVYGDTVASTGTITLTSLPTGDTDIDQVANINRVVQSKSELSSSQVDKQMNEDLK